VGRAWNDLLMDDHRTTEKVFAAMERAFAALKPPPPEMVAGMLEYFGTYLDQCHNRKEEDHLFPLIERRGIPRDGGPLAVMLMEHEQSRAILARLKPLAESYSGGNAGALVGLRDTFAEYVGLLKDHFWKENDILYPMAQRVLSEADARAVVEGIEATEAKLGQGTREKYYGLAERLATAGQVEDLSLGLDRAVLATILNTLPVELSFVDAEDTVRYFSHEDKDKIFARSRSVIGMKVQNCHPAKSVHRVSKILADFRSGATDVAEFWIDFQGKKINIRYFAVRGAGGDYLGSLEVVQDITRIQGLKGERRLLQYE